MRNIDRLRALEQELGRYRKKVEDQSKELKRRRQELEELETGAVQAGRAVDALLARTAVEYGEEVLDEETGERIGCRLTLPAFSIDRTLGQFEVHARRDEIAGTYIIGVVERKT